MRIQKAIVRKHFDRHAHEYDHFAKVQLKMMQTLLDQLPETLPTDPTILEIGCGTGRLTEQLRRKYPTAKITAIDLSSAMIEQAVHRLGDDFNLSWVCADAENWLANGTESYDLIVSNATLQWFEEPIPSVHRMKRLLSSGGSLHFTTLGPQTFWEFHQACEQTDLKLQVENQRRGQTFVSLEQWQSVVDAKEHYFIEYHPNVRAFMDSVRKIGASKADDGQSVLTKSYLKELQAQYENHLTSDGLLPATYHVIVGQV
jgi:malonyl-CoA O-methyltransferase